VTNIDLDVIR